MKGVDDAVDAYRKAMREQHGPDFPESAVQNYRKALEDKLRLHGLLPSWAKWPDWDEFTR